MANLISQQMMADIRQRMANSQQSMANQLSWQEKPNFTFVI
jgi:hypothetical protein